jgi:hypothetical protein
MINISIRSFVAHKIPNVLVRHGRRCKSIHCEQPRRYGLGQRILSYGRPPVIVTLFSLLISSPFPFSPLRSFYPHSFLQRPPLLVSHRCFHCSLSPFFFLIFFQYRCALLPYSLFFSLPFRWLRTVVSLALQLALMPQVILATLQPATFQIAIALAQAHQVVSVL